MKDKLFSLLDKLVSAERIRKYTEEIHRLEGDESYCNYKASTDCCMQMMRDAGFEQIERIALPADGKTAYFDCIMPQAWETTGRSFIRLDDERLSMDERMIADSAKDPFNAGVWGAPTPEKGVDCEIVDFRNTGKNAKAVRGKLVLMDGFSQAQYQFLAENGVAGVIISDSQGGEEYPDSCRWSNAIGFTGWYSTIEDQRIPVFSITPRRAAFLRSRLAQGKVTAHAEAKCRIYDGEIYTVTGVMPGESAQEITMVAHMYEPFLPDDAAGGAVIAELCRCINELISQKVLPPLKKSLRIVLSMERYGFHQYYMDEKRNQNTLIVFSFDSCCHFPGGKDQPQLKLRLSSMVQPTFLDLYLPELLRTNLPHRTFVLEKGNLSDDTFCSDDKIGIPSMWPHSANMRYHHNAGHDFMDADWDQAHDVAALMGTLVGRLATGDRRVFGSISRKCEELAAMEMCDLCTVIERDVQTGKLSHRDGAEKVQFHADKLQKQLASIRRFCPLELSYETGEEIRGIAKCTARSFHAAPGERELHGIEIEAAQTVVTRLVPGTLMSLVRVPHTARRRVAIPDLLYILFDGKRSVHQAIKLYEYENDCVFSEKEIEAVMTGLRYLEKYGYVKIETKGEKR